MSASNSATIASTLNGNRPMGSLGVVDRPAGSVAVSAGQAMIDIDAIITDTERVQAVALGGEILLLS